MVLDSSPVPSKTCGRWHGTAKEFASTIVWSVVFGVLFLQHRTQIAELRAEITELRLQHEKWNGPGEELSAQQPTFMTGAEHRHETAIAELRAEIAELRLQRQKEIGTSEEISAQQPTFMAKKMDSSLNVTRDENDRRLGTQFYSVAAAGAIASGSGCLKVTAADSFDMSSASCDNSVKCPTCFVATSLSADVDLEIVKCSTTRYKQTASITTNNVAEFVFINDDANNVVTIKAVTSASGTVHSTYYLQPQSSVSGLCYGGSSNKMYFPGDYINAGSGTVDTYSFNGKTITDLGSVTTADINGGNVDNTVIGASTPAAGTFTTVIATAIENSPIGATTAAAGTFTTVIATAIENSPIGATTAAAGTFTDITASGAVTISGTIQNTKPLLFEGTADAHELTLAIGSLTGDRTITLPNEDGTVITSGTTAIENIAIGGTTAAAGTFTTVIATAIENSPIGATTAAAGTFTDITANGNVVLGDDAAADVVTINGIVQGTKPLIFEGTADAHELTFLIGSLTTDRTITLPNEDGTVLTDSNKATHIADASGGTLGDLETKVNAILAVLENKGLVLTS